MKTFFSLFLLLTALTLWAQPPTAGLVLHLPFSGNANDASGNGLNGTVHGASLTTDRFGTPNRAYSFDGIGNYIDIPDNTILEPTNLTLSAWVYIEPNQPTLATIVGKPQCNGYYDSYTIAWVGGSLDAASASASKFIAHPNLGVPPTGEWMHVVYVFDAINNIAWAFRDKPFNLYVSSPISGSIYYDNQNFIIGADIFNCVLSKFFNGKVDDVRLYNRALSYAEVAALHNYELTPGDADGDGYSIAQGDCDDSNAAIYPGATEVCNGIDDDCDGLIDDADPGVSGQPWYADIDNDGYGDAGTFMLACNQPEGYISDNTDCDDANAAVHPGVTEICNGLDDNCNGLTDEGCISGTILWEHDGASGVNNTTVKLSGNQTAATTTNTSGYYLLTYTSGSNFTVTPTKNTNKLNGISSADATAVQQHVSNTSPLPGPFKRIAADVNKSNSITTLDASLITQALLGNPAANAIFNTSWRFVPCSYTFPNPNVPWGFPEKITLSGVTNGLSDQDFKGIKLGDVATAFANPALRPEDMPPPLMWTVPDRWLKAGETWEAEFRVNNFEDIAAYQFALKFDPAVLQLDDILPALALPVTGDNFGTANSKNGEIRTVWSVAKGLTIPDGQVVFHVRFKALHGGLKLSDVLYLDKKTLAPEAFTTALDATFVELSFLDTETSVSASENDGAARLVLYQNRPNPAPYWTIIGFQIPEACEAMLRVTDVAGRNVAQRSAFYPAGYSEISLQLGASLSPGVYFYELVTPFGTRSQRMVWVSK